MTTGAHGNECGARATAWTGGSSNMLPFWDNSTAVFGQSLYVGTWNYANGGEVWILLKQVLLPLVSAITYEQVPGAAHHHGAPHLARVRKPRRFHPLSGLAEPLPRRSRRARLPIAGSIRSTSGVRCPPATPRIRSVLCPPQ